MKLYSGPLSMFGMKAHIALLEKGLVTDVIMVSYSDEQGYHPKHPKVLEVNPKAQVPVLLSGELALYDSTQIFEYLEDLQATPNLWPTDISLRAQARLLEHQSDEVYFPYVVQLMGLQEDLKQTQAQQAIAACSAYEQLMEKQLQEQDYLLGNLSFADIAFFMAQLFGERMGAVMTQETPRLLAWRDRMLDRPSVQQAVKPLVDFLSSVNRPIPEFLNFILDPAQ